MAIVRKHFPALSNAMSRVRCAVRTGNATGHVATGLPRQRGNTCVMPAAFATAASRGAKLRGQKPRSSARKRPRIARKTRQARKSMLRTIAEPLGEVDLYPIRHRYDTDTPQHYAGAGSSA
jgi:hypothetical protein